MAARSAFRRVSRGGSWSALDPVGPPVVAPMSKAACRARESRCERTPATDVLLLPVAAAGGASLRDGVARLADIPHRDVAEQVARAEDGARVAPFRAPARALGHV